MALLGGKKLVLALGSILAVSTAAVIGLGASEVKPVVSLKRCDCDCSCEYCMTGQCDFKREAAGDAP